LTLVATATSDVDTLSDRKTPDGIGDLEQAAHRKTRAPTSALGYNLRRLRDCSSDMILSALAE
jgi:hypothetical protein